ncbi:hypothetical protein PENANT_c294G02633, partial [Penicillium antarcticum]
ILEYPGYTKQGTNSMGRHWRGEKCRRARTQAQQPNIRRLLQDEASHNGLITQPPSKEEWEDELTTTIAILRLPF